ncbi:hypothetical protein QH494_10475 [Sphingomonas sp. AR_OL41]|uniref:hypothetical protein n=1 Tax=Sphingomonas sp. AR_OL41 TaxID=3042729 RepID=UPI00248030C7|nr:hypothetical protein [Sphingomonas sp. AR_OL41]MDH7972607.1 hypothetical protein [Sphingomonas sp. AR_OL41]
MRQQSQNRRPTRISFRHAGILLAGLGTTLPLPALAVDRARSAPVVESAAAAQRALQAALEAFRQGDCVTATRDAAALVATDPSPLSVQLRPFAYEVMAGCALRTGAKEDAYRYAVAGTAIEGAPEESWQFRFLIAAQGGMYADAIATIETMARDHPSMLDKMPTRYLYELDNHLIAEGTVAQRRRLLGVVTSGKYTPVDPMMSPDYFRYRLAALLIEAGDQAGATREMSVVRNPRVWFDANLDPRLRVTLPRDFDVRRVVEQGLAEMRTLAAQHPDLLGPVVRAAGYLHALGRPQEAVQSLEALHPRIGKPGAFSDAAEQAAWWWDRLADNYGALGRYDDSDAALRSGAAAEENGSANVSQVINLAGNQLQYSHFADALATIALFDEAKRNVSGFGMMQIQLIRGCARARSGKPADAAAELSYLRAHEKDAPPALTNMLLCLGDLDAAAASFARRLNDPALRVEALRQLSDYDAPPVRLPDDPFTAQLPAIKARPDVQAAIAHAGGARRIHLQSGQF